MRSRPRIEIGKVEQKCPGEVYGPSQRIVNPYPKRDQERGIVSKKIRVNEPDPGLQHQLGSVVGLGKIDPILSLTGKPDLGQVSCKAELYSGPNDTFRCKNRSACKLNARQSRLVCCSEIRLRRHPTMLGLSIRRSATSRRSALRLVRCVLLDPI